MSSNPFRRSRVPVEPDPASASIFEGVRAPSDETAPTTPHQRTKTKRVVIQTPPHSPEETHSRPDGDARVTEAGPGRSASPPPVEDARDARRDGRESERESTITADPDLHQLRSSTRDSTGALTPSDATAAGAMRAPYNPFARTLATRETWSRDEGGAGANGKEQRAKPTLDVDAFKNILLTGAPIPVGLSTHTRAPRPQDSNSSSTDTSSIFDPSHGFQPESPKDAYQDDESASEDGDHGHGHGHDHDHDHDHEHSGLVGVGRSDDLAPPAPPKSKAKGPQTVSFADFDQSIPPGFMASGPRTDPVHTQHLTGILRSASPRPGSDLNKPLPPPPRDTTRPVPPSVPDKNTPPLQPAVTDAPVAPAIKAVPPPPPSRKSGSGHGRARSSSNLSNMTQDSTLSAPAESVVSGPSNKLAPPPPPTRKSHQVHQPVPQPKDLAHAQHEGKLVPPPPPLRRHPSNTGKGSFSVSRQASDDSSTAPRIGPATTTTCAAPPPPPPRRPHRSKRTSLDGPPSSFTRRLSGEHYRGSSFDSERSASISSLQKVAEIREGSELAVESSEPGRSRDILAEMSAFQAELDALAQASKGK